MRINQMNVNNEERSNLQPKNFGSVMIITDKSSYFAGEFISGNIYLNVIGDGFPGCIVYLGIIGKEKCEWEEIITNTETETTTDQNGNQIIKETTTSKTELHKGKFYIYQQKLEIHNFESSPQPLGQFVFPFQFQFISSAPSSYYEKDRAQISYKVKAFVQLKKSSIPFIKHSQKLIIRETLRNYIAALVQECQVTSRKCCFKKNGPCYIKCTIDKFHFLPGNEVNFNFDIDNSRFDQPINYLLIQLYQKLTLCDNKGRQSCETYQKANHSIEGVKARKQQQFNVKLVLKNDLLPSAKGKIIDSLYYLNISPSVKSSCSCCCYYPCCCCCCCCPSGPYFETITFPIQIIAPSFENNDPFLQEPQKQNAQVLLTQINLKHENQNVVKYKQQKDTMSLRTLDLTNAVVDVTAGMIILSVQKHDLQKY